MATTAAEVNKFRFGATVIASDGEAGTLNAVVVQPGQRIVTMVGIKLPGNARVAMPVERVLATDSKEVHVSLTREALLQTLQPIPADAIQFTPSTRVTLNDRGAGTLTQVTINTQDARLRRIGIKQGLGEALADAAWITSIGENGVLAVSVPVGAALAHYRADNELRDAVYEALWNYSRLRIDMRAIDIQAVDGEVWLRGHVSSSLNRRITSELIQDLKGLTTVHNELVADPDLALTIARALANDPATRQQLIGVYPVLGQVYLRGRVLTQDAYEKALTIARASAGSGAVVVNQLAINQAAQFVPTLAPVTGSEDIIPGGD